MHIMIDWLHQNEHAFYFKDVNYVAGMVQQRRKGSELVIEDGRKDRGGGEKNGILPW